MMTLPADPVWFITGCSTGFGREMAKSVIERGWRVVATARKIDQLHSLMELGGERCLPVALDVTKPSQVQEAIADALKEFGSIDILVNNAGYGYLAAVEEGEDDEVRAMFETNVFGLADLTRSALPHMRARGSGWIVNITSVGGLIASPGSGWYCATKFAVEALSEALAQELKPLGLKVLIVEPGHFRTDWGGRSLKTPAREIAAYAETAGARRKGIKENSGKQPGDPARGAQAIITALSSDTPPLRLVLGEGGLSVARAKMQSVLDELHRWEQVSVHADFPSTGITPEL